jgi:hypothetical protein
MLYNVNLYLTGIQHELFRKIAKDAASILGAVIG